MLVFRIYVILLMLVVTNSYADFIDSIHGELHLLSGNKKLDMLYELAMEKVQTDPEVCEQLANELLERCGEEQFVYKGLAYHALGEMYYYKEMYAEALEKYVLAEPFFLKSKDSVRISANYSNKGLMYYYRADYDRAALCYEKSLAIDEVLNDSVGIAKACQNLGLIFSEGGSIELQREYYERAGEIYKELNDVRSSADIYLNLGVSCSRVEDYKRAKRYYKKALGIYEDIGDSSRIASIQNNLGCAFMNEGDYVVAENYFNKSRDIFQALGEKMGMVYALTGLGDLYAQKGMQNKAVELYKRCEEINESIGILGTQQENLMGLYEAYKKMGRYKEAVRVLEDYYALRDSVFNEAQISKMNELESKYLFQKSQNEVSELTARNRLYVILIIVIAFLFLLGVAYAVYYHHTRKLQEKQRLLRLEQKVLRTQMNPHFIFNSLSAIQCYVLDNKVSDAVDFLADFAGLMRMVLQYSQDEYISLEQELEILEFYINLQNRRFGERISYDIVVDGSLDNAKTLIPPMLAQPFIENSFEHGELYKREGGSISVRFERCNGSIHYCIEDNGIGLDVSMDKKVGSTKKHKSLAMKITRERLGLINQSNSNKVGLMVEDRNKYGEEGTRVLFTIPYREMG